MKKLLGTINVYLDDEQSQIDPKEPESSYCNPKKVEDGWPTEFEICVKAKADSLVCAKDLNNLTEQEKIQTLMCHEIGHAVAIMTRDRAQHPMYQAINGEVKAEENAWKLAQRMTGCYVDPTMKRRALGSYVEAIRKDEADPLFGAMRRVAKRMVRERPDLGWLKEGEGNG